jgi:hypothetical protein
MATVVTPVRFYANVPGTSDIAVYTVPASQIDVVTGISINNNTDVAAQVSIKMAGVFFCKNLDIPPRSLVALDSKTVLNTVETISVYQNTASACSVFISGVKVNEV